MTLKNMKEGFCKLPYYLEQGGVCRQLAVKINDHSGYKTGGLAKACEKSGILLPDKELMDPYKTCMNVAYESLMLRPLFKQYALGDLCLPELWYAHENSSAKQRILLNLPPAEPKWSKGSNVAAMISAFVEQECPLTKEHIDALGVQALPNESPVQTLLRHASVAHLYKQDKEWTVVS